MIKTPENFTVETLQGFWNEALSVYAPVFQRARLLDAADRGKLWKAIAAKFPKYQVLPDTNHVNYVKSNLLASLYSVGRSATLRPTSEEDVELTTHLNLMLDHLWDTRQVPYYQMLAGERAALLNYGVTQIGWDNSITKGTDDNFFKGDFTLKNIDPLKFMRDPFAESLDTAAYCVTWDDYHKQAILRNPRYTKEFEEFLKTTTVTPASDTIETMKDHSKSSIKDYYRIQIYFVMDAGKIHEIHLVNNAHVLFVKEDIRPSMHPFAELYCNLPAGDLFGTSGPSSIFANSVAYNLMNSVILTAEIKNQKPPKFVNNQSQINLRDFIQHGADSDYTFVVQGDASRAVHYHQFPQTSAIIPGIMNMLNMDMQQISGVDGKYTGKDTGSLLTTGGMEQMLNQATLIDQPKIVNYEHYTLRMTRIILGHLMEYGTSRKYFVKDPKTNAYKTVVVDFEEIDPETAFDYALDISAHLPKNKQRISQMANVIMEKQLQYAGNGEQPVQLITPEEWLRMQDLPYQELMLDRMGVERKKDYLDQTAKVVMQYADLVGAGMAPEDALLSTAESMRTGEPVQPPMQAPVQEMPPQIPPME